jgi:septal ring factor EnvC (AmiA/AmiB activator)
MGLLKPPRAATTRIIFNVPTELACRLKELEKKAAQLGIEVSLDRDLAQKLEKMIAAAEKELNKNLSQRSDSADSTESHL